MKNGSMSKKQQSALAFGAILVVSPAIWPSPAVAQEEICEDSQPYDGGPCHYYECYYDYDGSREYVRYGAHCDGGAYGYSCYYWPDPQDSDCVVWGLLD